jgi:hypothetical protein
MRARFGKARARFSLPAFSHPNPGFNGLLCSGGNSAAPRPRSPALPVPPPTASLNDASKLSLHFPRTRVPRSSPPCCHD